MNEVTRMAIDFIENYFEKFDLKRCDLEGYSKKKAVSECKKEYWFSCWVLSELMSWSLEEDHLKKYVVEHEGDFLVLKIEDKYFKYSLQTYCFEETFNKTKIVNYFE